MGSGSRITTERGSSAPSSVTIAPCRRNGEEAGSCFTRLHVNPSWPDGGVLVHPAASWEHGGQAGSLTGHDGRGPTQLRNNSRVEFSREERERHLLVGMLDPRSSATNCVIRTATRRQPWPATRRLTVDSLSAESAMMRGQRRAKPDPRACPLAGKPRRSGRPRFHVHCSLASYVQAATREVCRENGAG